MTGTHLGFVAPPYIYKIHFFFIFGKCLINEIINNLVLLKNRVVTLSIGLHQCIHSNYAKERVNLLAGENTSKTYMIVSPTPVKRAWWTIMASSFTYGAPSLRGRRVPPATHPASLVAQPK